MRKRYNVTTDNGHSSYYESFESACDTVERLQRDGHTGVEYHDLMDDSP